MMRYSQADIDLAVKRAERELRNIGVKGKVRPERGPPPTPPPLPAEAPLPTPATFTTTSPLGTLTTGIAAGPASAMPTAMTFQIPPQLASNLL